MTIALYGSHSDSREYTKDNEHTQSQCKSYDVCMHGYNANPGKQIVMTLKIRTQMQEWT